MTFIPCWTLASACALFLLQQVSLASSQTVSSQPSKGSLCVTASGQFGKCSRLLACKTRRWIRAGPPDICFNDNGVVIICCPTELNPRRSKKVPVCGLSLTAGTRAKRQVHLDSEVGDGDNSTGDPDHFIVGGRDALLGQYPWMALLYSDADVERTLPMCGGSLISIDSVLTAAHCVYDRDYKWLVRLGEHKLSDTNDGTHLVEMRVKEVKIHEGYSPPSLYNDVAVLRLERRVPLTSKLLPICLPLDLGGKTFDGVKAIASGWGALETAGPNADTLQEVDLPIISNDLCDTAYKNFTSEPMPSLPKGITSEIVCAGDGIEVKDACQGDSGGPLMVFEASISRWIQVGIVSAGIYCDGGYPGLYARVTEYVNWIQKAIS